MSPETKRPAGDQPAGQGRREEGGTPGTTTEEGQPQGNPTPPAAAVKLPGFTVDQLLDRRKYIGASEVGALFGVGRLTYFQLWHQKKGTLPPEPGEKNDFTFWGHLLEDDILEGVRYKTGWPVGRHGITCHHPSLPGLASTPDGWRRGFGPVEAKNVDRMEFARWPGGQPPLGYQLQLQTQMAVGNAKWGCIACLVGGNDLKLFEYEANEDVREAIAREVGLFWQSIEEDLEPPPEFRLDAAFLEVLYPDFSPAKVLMSDDPRIVSDCYTLATMPRASSLFRNAAARVAHYMGRHGVLQAGDFLVTSKLIPREFVPARLKPARRTLTAHRLAPVPKGEGR